MIACLLLPCFSAEVMRRVHHLPVEIPLVVFSSGGKVSACSENAERKGIVPGLSRAQVHWYCPEARLVDADEDALQRAEQQVLETCAFFTPRVEMAPGGQVHAFYLDLERLAPPEAHNLAGMLRSRLQTTLDWEGQIGLAGGKFPAFAFASGLALGEVRYLPPEVIQESLASLPLNLLPLGTNMARRLNLLGITTLGAFAGLPSSAVLAQFGKAGVHLHQLAQGIDPRPVVPFKPEIITRARATIEQGVSDRWVLEQLLGQVVTRLVHRLRELGSMGQTLHLSLNLESDGSLKAHLTLRRAASGRTALTQGATRLLNRLSPRAPVVALELSIADLLPFAGQQLPLWGDQPPPRERLRERLEALLTRPDAPTCLYFTPLNPTASRLECRYQAERVAS